MERWRSSQACYSRDGRVESRTTGRVWYGCRGGAGGPPPMDQPWVLRSRRRSVASGWNAPATCRLPGAQYFVALVVVAVLVAAFRGRMWLSLSAPIALWVLGKLFSPLPHSSWMVWQVELFARARGREYVQSEPSPQAQRHELPLELLEGLAAHPVRSERRGRRAGWRRAVVGPDHDTLLTAR